jgi:hypothetical protein
MPCRNTMCVHTTNTVSDGLVDECGTGSTAAAAAGCHHLLSLVTRPASAPPNIKHDSDMAVLLQRCSNLMCLHALLLCLLLSHVMPIGARC